MRLFTTLAISLHFIGGEGAAFAAEPDGDRPQNSYSLTLEVVPTEGAAQRVSFVSSGGQIDASFVSGESEVNGASIPMIASFKTDLEAIEGNKVWLGRLSFTRTVPYVTAFSDYGGLNATPGVGRVRTVPNRTLRSSDEGGASGEATMSDAPASQAAPPRSMTRSLVQQANVGISTSLVLTLGKPITLFEDSKGRVRLTVNKVQE